MDRYTHLSLMDARGALENLPTLPSGVPAEEQAKATGTDGDVGKKYGPGYGPAPDVPRPSSSLVGNEGESGNQSAETQKCATEEDLALVVPPRPAMAMASPTGFEPVACGLGNRQAMLQRVLGQRVTRRISAVHGTE
jgi:hypothetical protein